MSKYKVGSFVFYKDRIYEIFQISNIDGKLIYSIDIQNDMYINVENEDELSPTKNDKKNYKIGDKVKYYDQKDDNIHEGIIKEWYRNAYVYFEDGNGTFIDYLGNENKKLRKFDINQNVMYNKNKFNIKKYFISDSEFYYILDNDEAIKESMLSPII